MLLLLLLLTNTIVINNNLSLSSLLLSSTTSTTSVLFVSAVESNSDNIISSGRGIGSESNNKISKEQNNNDKTCTTTTATVANDNDNDNSNGGECETSTTSASASTSTSTSTSTSKKNLNSTAATNSESNSDSNNKRNRNHQKQTVGKLSFTIDDILQLKPTDIPLPHIFTDFGSPTNTTVTIPLPIPTMIEKNKKKNNEDVSNCQDKDPTNCKVLVGWDANICERNTGFMHTHCARSCQICTSQISASSSYADNDDDDDDETATAITPTTKVIQILPGSIMQHNINSNHHKNNNNNAIVDNTTESQSQSNSITSFESKLYVLPQFVPRDVVAQILTLLRGHEDMIVANGQQLIALNEDPDPVDAMTSQRIFLEEDDIERKGERSPSQSTQPQRELRRKLKLLMDPYKELMTSFLRTWYVVLHVVKNVKTLNSVSKM